METGIQAFLWIPAFAGMTYVDRIESHGFCGNIVPQNIQNTESREKSPVGNRPPARGVRLARPGPR